MKQVLPCAVLAIGTLWLPSRAMSGPHADAPWGKR